MYEHGYGTERDIARAKDLYLRAHRSGNPAGACALHQFMEDRNEEAHREGRELSSESSRWLKVCARNQGFDKAEGSYEGNHVVPWRVGYRSIPWKPRSRVAKHWTRARDQKQCTDSLGGGDGHDFLSGGTGNDSLYGDDGADYLDCGAGIDTLVGGDGNGRLAGSAESGTFLAKAGRTSSSSRAASTGSWVSSPAWTGPRSPT